MTTLRPPLRSNCLLTNDRYLTAPSLLLPRTNERSPLAPLTILPGTNDRCPRAPLSPPPQVCKRIQKFSAGNRLKKEAAKLIASNLPEDEINGMRQVCVCVRAHTPATAQQHV